MKGILRHKQVIVFDFDGLLVNTEEIYWDGWKFSFQENNISVSNQLISSFTGKSIEEVDRLLLNQGIDFKMLQRLREFREKYIIEMIDSPAVTLLPGVKEFLDYSISKYKLAICTSLPRKRLEKVLNSLGILCYFDKIVAYEDTLEHKPSPMPYKKIIEHYTTPSSNIIVFEDSCSGVLSAKKNGLETHCVNKFLTSEHLKICLPDFCHKSFYEVMNKL